MARKEPGAGESPESQETASRFPLRPGKGSCGTPCKVKANHFSVVFQNKDLHHYNVSITPETSHGIINRAVIKKLVKEYMSTHLGNRLPAYDGMKSLFTAGALPFESKEFEITLNGQKDCPGGGPRGARDFIVIIKFAGHIDLSHLAMFLHGKQPSVPQEALRALNIVLNELPNSRPSYCPVGRSFYSLDIGKRQSLGYGLESWRGFYQSFRPTQRGLSLNIDMSSTAFIEHIPVIEFVNQLLGYEFFTESLTVSAREKIKKALCGVEIEVTHAGLANRRKYCISGLTSQPTKELNFPIGSRTYYVAEYFLEKYGREIKHTHLPCLEVGNSKRSIYLPMEVCRIRAGQRYSKRLNEEQNTELLKFKCQRPYEREMNILRAVKCNAYADDPHAKEFGIKISRKLARVEARVLSPPWLKYLDDSGEEEEFCLPEVGQWNMMDKKLYKGGKIKKWTLISFTSGVTEIIAKEFCNNLAIMCQDFGMEFDIEPVLLPVMHGNPGNIEFVLKELIVKLKPYGKKLDLLIVILPDNNGSLYGDLKRICETKLGIVSQCCLQKHVLDSSSWKQYLANVALKINVKFGGKNTVLGHALSEHKDCVGDISTIIFGADITHPHPGDTSSPSIAAVVASQDWPEVAQYASLVSAQISRQERIQDLYRTSQDPVKGTVHGGMIRGLLMSWKENNNSKAFPERIIFYRDGVSEGQFSQVLFYELDAIRKACASLQPDYQPTVTFVVVQKRHNTRLFANNHNDMETVDSSGNILPGTVVDSKICHPREFDFYLCSHAGIQGTSRPAHYHVLWDENNFSADDLQSLTNNLCYTYARCTRSVSIVPPVYYAHLAASRARFYMDPMASDAASIGVIGANDVKPLPEVMPNVKKFMFYC